jgi:hypothetical protein
VSAVSAAAITNVVDAVESAAWLQGALGELHATMTAQNAPVGGPAGGNWIRAGRLTWRTWCGRPARTPPRPEASRTARRCNGPAGSARRPVPDADGVRPACRAARVRYQPDVHGGDAYRGGQ